MAARTTRQSLAELSESILNDEKDIVIIPAQLLIKLLSTHATALDMYAKTAENFNEALNKFSSQAETTTAALDRVTSALENLRNERDSDFQNSLLEKLDDLSKTFASNAGTSGVSHEEKLKKYVKKRKEILSKTIRAEKLSEYYSELISADTPFVPRKFRTKVSRMTPDFEKPVHKEDSIYKVKLQIKLMDERIKNWKEELHKHEFDTNILLQSMDTNDSETFLATVAESDEVVRQDRIKSVEKLRETYTKEMNKESVNPDLFLLTYADKSHQRSSKNVSGRPPRWCGRGKGRPQN